MVRDHLKTVAAVTTLVGATRIYAHTSPNAIKVTHIRVHEIDGNRLHNVDFAAPSVQVSVFSQDETELSDVREAVIENMRNRKGSMGSYFVVSVYQADQGPFPDNNWWHTPIQFGLRFMEG